jgi:glucosamine-6-phosphate deaminase
MKLCIWKDADELGRQAAAFTATAIQRAIAEKGCARLLLSTGASQFETFKYLVTTDVPWEKVEMFHLDEYVGLPETHPASFRKYLKDRFASKVSLGMARFVCGEGNVAREIQKLTDDITKAPIDIALVGIGENAHIAFNDPPADFSTEEAYKVVTLDERCKQQQVREGWFSSNDAVPKQAITMTVRQILKCKIILSCVPHRIKAEAIRQTLENDPANIIPATILKTHPNLTLYLDEESASLIPPKDSRA